MKKKHILFAAFFAMFGLSSCDMEKYPYSSIEESLYMKTLNDFASARIGLYSSYRSVTSGGYLFTSDFQCDDFMASADYSNTYGSQYRWIFQTTDGNIEGIWGGYYGMIARANYYIDSYTKTQGMTDGFSESDSAKMSAYVAEAYFTRAYAYLQLAGYYCKAYDANTAGQDLGLPLQLIYNPSSDASKYPGRSTLAETYDQIYSDIENAEKMVNPEAILDGKDAIHYISADAVQALKARAALQRKDYALAASTASALIDSGKYPLASTERGFRDIWLNDKGSEIIWLIYMDKNELGSPNGLRFWGQYIVGDQSLQKPDFIPSQELLDLYSADDIRLTSYFADFDYTASNGSTGNIKVFDKYPGNPAIYSQTNVDNHYVNMSKPFHISEMYLIAAEAYANTGNLNEGSKYLNALKQARISGYEGGTYGEANLLSEIQSERRRELVGEGFRFTDLKRWGLGIDRGNNYQNNNLVLLPGNMNTTALRKEADDYRFIWPIPKSEIDSNPQLKGQQNPGY